MTKLYSGSTPILIEGDIFQTIIPLREQAGEQVGEQVGEQASILDYKDRILKFCNTSKSRVEMQSYLKISSRRYFIQKILKPLIEEGLLLLTIPDKPTSPNQKYYSN